MDEKKKKAIEEALKQIEKQFGKGTVMQLGDTAIVKVDVIPTGSIGLDYALGIGGVPRGRIVEIFGQEASGKTTLALHIIAEAQKRGGITAFIDAEHALDPKYAGTIGVNVENLLISQPDTGEQALEIAETLVRSGGIDLIVVDSVAALVPKAEIDGEMGDAHVGLQARLMSQALRKLTGVLSKSYTSAVFINQVRYKIGMMFGPQYTTPGGLALKFHSSVRIDIRNLGAIKDGEQNVGMRVSCKVVKNKLAPPFRAAEFDIIYGSGISKEGELIDMGLNMGLITKTGSWYNYGEEKIGQGREKVRTFLLENKDIKEKIEVELREKLGLIDEDRDKRKKKENNTAY